MIHFELHLLASSLGHFKSEIQFKITDVAEKLELREATLEIIEVKCLINLNNASAYPHDWGRLIIQCDDSHMIQEIIKALQESDFGMMISTTTDVFVPSRPTT
ncbi:hypothetical protein KKH39_04400 [Patescibacteria group bacterium]|nr:hypothetical protein [Patescibacteria group bacterium]